MPEQRSGVGGASHDLSLTKGALVRGVLADRSVKVVDAEWHGSNAITLTYTDEATGKADHELLLPG